MPGRQAKKRFMQRMKRERRRIRSGLWNYDSDDPLNSDGEDYYDMGFDKESMQRKHGISDELWDFIQANRDVEQALDGLVDYDIKRVVENWDKELMPKIMGSDEEADSVLRKLKA